MLSGQLSHAVDICLSLWTFFPGFGHLWTCQSCPHRPVGPRPFLLDPAMTSPRLPPAWRSSPTLAPEFAFSGRAHRHRTRHVHRAVNIGLFVNMPVRQWLPIVRQPGPGVLAPARPFTSSAQNPSPPPSQLDRYTPATGSCPRKAGAPAPIFARLGFHRKPSGSRRWPPSPTQSARASAISTSPQTR